MATQNHSVDVAAASGMKSVYLTVHQAIHLVGFGKATPNRGEAWRRVARREAIRGVRKQDRAAIAAKIDDQYLERFFGAQQTLEAFAAAERVSALGRRKNSSVFKPIDRDDWAFLVLDILESEGGGAHPRDLGVDYDQWVFKEVIFRCDELEAALAAPPESEPARAEEPRTDHKTDKKTARRPGRPSYKANIVAAYRALAADGTVDFNAPKSKMYPLVRDRVKQDLNKLNLDKGLSAEAIRTAAGPLFDLDKAGEAKSP